MHPHPSERLPTNDRTSTSPAVEDADAREFEAFAQAQDPLDIEAATWVARRRNGLDAQGEAELQAWLDTDRRHAAAFDDMAATLGDVQHLPGDEVASLRAGLSEARRPASTQPPTVVSPLAPPSPRRRRSWRLDLGQLFPQAAAAIIAFAVMGGAWIGWERWEQKPIFDKTYATERGHQLTVSLPDAEGGVPLKGSILQLDTATRLDARLYRDRREVRLKEGQAMFSVHSDAERPFHVWAGALRITVVGTRFSVRRTATGLDAGQTVVSVEEGHVRVARVDRPTEGRSTATANIKRDGPAVELMAGQMVVADDSGHIGPVADVPASAIAPWRDGRISFDQTPLAQALAEFERYGRIGLVVRDPAVAALRVGGSYSLRQWQRFAGTLHHVLPVRLVQRGDVTEVVAR